MRFLAALALALVVSLFGAAAPASADVQFGISVSASHSFHAPLAPHGQWFVHGSYGNVWRPVQVDRGWRPYSYGQWVHTDYGWAFDSDEPWAWATYHYGRWYLDPYYGWVWIPGTEWAPAWVAFYEVDDWIGWAPLGPTTTFQVGYNFRPRYDHRSYCFVERRHFLDRHVGRRLQPVDRNDRFIARARSVARFDRMNGSLVTRGPDAERIGRDIGRAVPRHRVRDLPNLRREVPRPPRVASQPRDSREARFDRRDERRDDRRPDRRLEAMPAPAQRVRPTERPQVRPSDRPEVRRNERPQVRQSEPARPSRPPQVRRDERPPTPPRATRPERQPEHPRVDRERPSRQPPPTTRENRPERQPPPSARRPEPQRRPEVRRPERPSGKPEGKPQGKPQGKPERRPPG